MDLWEARPKFKIVGDRRECIDPFGNLINQLSQLTCNKRGSTNKSPNKLNATEIKFDTSDLFKNRENH